jgi:hypothetical protein
MEDAEHGRQLGHNSWTRFTWRVFGRKCETGTNRRHPPA